MKGSALLSDIYDGIEANTLHPQTYEGIAVGDRVRITRDLAQDVKRGNIGVVTALDDHPAYPVTVTVQKMAGQDVKGLPVGLDEIELDR